MTGKKSVQALLCHALVTPKLEYLKHDMIISMVILDGVIFDISET